MICRGSNSESTCSGCKGVWPGRELQAAWHCWGKAAVSGEMGPCLGKGCQRGRLEPELKNTSHFVGNVELPQSGKLGCAVVRLIFHKDRPGASVLLCFWGLQRWGGEAGEEEGS